MPNMGIKRGAALPKRREGLADALFSTTQQRVLGLLFGQPDRSFYATQLIAMTGSGSGAVQRELSRLERAGLVSVTRQGTQKHYQADPGSPLFDELCGIARKTVGLAEPLRHALAPFAKNIDAAFVYGSVAKRTDSGRSDIDVMIVGDGIDYASVLTALLPTQQALGREINPTIFSPKELKSRIADRASFVERVLAQPKIWIIGNADALPAR